MTRGDVSADRTAEFRMNFMALDENGQDAALIMLKALEFAQSVLNADKITLADAPQDV